MNEKPILTQILESPLPEEEKRRLTSIVNGDMLASLCSDLIAKHVFSPDLHPERLNFIFQRTMRDSTIEIDRSAANESSLRSYGSKMTISDIPAWLKDHRIADLAIQVRPQEFIFNRADIYASNMLLLQYSVDPGVQKGTIDVTDIKDSILIVLMANSPRSFREHSSNRYIHRFTKARSDTGLEFEMLKQMVFVQLDKALELYISKEYNEDEDVELLELFALIADINNETVIELCNRNRLLNDIREDVYKFTQSREVQQMILAEDLDRRCYLTDLHLAQKEGRTTMINLNKWLIDQGRFDEIKRYTEDPEYLEALIEEYNKAHE